MKYFLEYFQNTKQEDQLVIYPLILFVSYIFYLITKRIILNAISKLFNKTSTKIDDALLERKVFNKLPYLIPLIFIYSFRDMLPWIKTLDRFIISLIALIILLSLNSLINALNDVYLRSRFSEKLNIKSYLQILKLIVNMLGAIIIIAFLAGKSPVYFLSGIGALTAVLILVFKDTILSLVSSIQISSNKLFKVGDWIEAPQFGADGNVVDIALHSVKIQNWDKTISIVPTNKLIDSSFKNWKGMSESGGRRIKRSIKLDIQTIKFCTKSMIEKFRSFALIKEYIDTKVIEIDKYNIENNFNDASPVNGRSLTNIGTFRAYVECYLRSHAKIHGNMTFLVRQLAPKSDGVPIEIYVFSNDTNWINYEAIQSDIFDHLLAVLPQFELKVFQNLTGDIFRKNI